jgi:hypothetical protein
MFSLLLWPPAIAVVSAVDGIPAAVPLALLLLFFMVLLLVAAGAGVLLLAVLLLLQRPCLTYRTAAICSTDNFFTTRISNIRRVSKTAYHRIRIRASNYRNTGYRTHKKLSVAQL